MIVKSVFVIGQCTLHWGRMEFGNIGNYYIIRPMFEELRRIFPEAIIKTTMQFSEEFCNMFSITTLPMELYYDFNSIENLKNSRREFETVDSMGYCSSPYVKEIESSDVVIDFSGDIWGDNAEFVGKDRFYTGLYKDLTAQLLKPTIMLSVSLGPFSEEKDKSLIELCLKGFKLIICREKVSVTILENEGFQLNNLMTFPCPSFLFKGSMELGVKDYPLITREISNQPLVGVIMCGWNFRRGPFDIWPREDSEYDNFVSCLKNLILKYNAKIVLMSHSNGFNVPANPFVLKHGRDYPIIKQLGKCLRNEMGEQYNNDIIEIDNVCLPEATKGIIGEFDMLVSGRMHGAVAGLSQCIPTVIVDYGHEPKAHKLMGYAQYVDMAEMIADPNSLDDLIIKTEYCIENREKINKKLCNIIPEVQELAKKQFDILKDTLESECC